MINGLAERLRQLRINSGLSQRTVANRLKISPSIISSYETGERTPSTENLLALSYLYRCTTDFLLGREQIAKSCSVSVDGLTPRQIKILAELIDTMRK